MQNIVWVEVPLKSDNNKKTGSCASGQVDQESARSGCRQLFTSYFFFKHKPARLKHKKNLKQQERKNDDEENVRAESSHLAFVYLTCDVIDR